VPSATGDREPAQPLARATTPRDLGSAVPGTTLRWVAAILLVAVSAVAITFFVASKSHGGRTAARSRLAPDPTALRYRHPITPPDAPASSSASRAELDDGIAALGERAKQVTPSPFDLGELADLYFRRAKLTGDLADYARAEELA
jgi:hypothetical protein